MTNPIEHYANRVILGDCLQVLRELPAASVDMVLTDPPYLVRYKDRQGRTVANDDNDRWLFPAFAELYRVMKPNSYCVSFYGWGRAERFLSAWKECGFAVAGHFVWVKRYAAGARHTQRMHEQAYLLVKGNPLLPASPPADVIPWTYTGNKLHPTQKPVQSLTPLVQAYSKPDGIVLDPFGGSGATGEAALRCGRKYILMEKDPIYHMAAQGRMGELLEAREATRQVNRFRTAAASTPKPATLVASA